jgi:putative transposase
MDEQYLLVATRYIELNPVRAGLVSIPEEYPWSSAGAHIKGKNDDLVQVKPLLRMVGDWRRFLSGDVSTEEYELLQRHERTGRPLGSKNFIERLENRLSRILTPRKAADQRRIDKTGMVSPDFAFQYTNICANINNCLRQTPLLF